MKRRTHVIVGGVGLALLAGVLALQSLDRRTSSTPRPATGAFAGGDPAMDRARAVTPTSQPDPPAKALADTRATGGYHAPIGLAGADEQRAPARKAMPIPPLAAEGKRADDGWGLAPFPPPQGVKAGEWDDNANYREFQRLLAAQANGAHFHEVDIRARRFLVVRDVEGKAIPRCTVTVGDGNEHEVSFVTTASGRAIFFPHAEGFTSKDFVATARCADAPRSVQFSLNDDDDGIVDLKLAEKRPAITVRPVDVAFVLDTTGSMSEEIAAVKSTIQKVAKSLGTREIKVRVGLVEYKDKGDDFVTKLYPMTTDLDAFQRKISGIFASGGGDLPEHMTAGLHDALTKLDWNKEAVARMAFIIGDAPPHLDYDDNLDYVKEMKDAAHRGVQLFTIAASGMDTAGQIVWRQMAQYTGGTEMFVLRGGAGRQSTGGGDPLSSCGGTQQQYASGNLDELITRKIQRELEAIDKDPMRIPGLKKDESAKPCSERIALD